MVAATALRGAYLYELRMTARSRFLLPALSLVVLGLAVTALASPRTARTEGLRPLLGDWALILNLLTPVAVAVVLADRLYRVHRAAGQAELLTSTPSRASARIAGTVCGSLTVALAPAIVALLLVGLVLTAVHGDPAALGLAVLAVVAVLGPSTAFLSAFAMTLALVVRPQAARLATIALWVWVIAWNPRLLPGPSLTGTVLAPAGDYPVAGFFGAAPLWAGRVGSSVLAPTPTVGSALLNLALVLVGTALLLVLARRLLERR
ncbi:hypothetical protein [Crossiella equi]|nr:hypothetical protein [Crossiella equi]